MASPLTELAAAVGMLAQRGAGALAATAHGAPALFGQDGDY